MILENQTLEMKNVLSYRAKMMQHQLNTAMKNIGEFIQQKGAKISGYITTATFAIEKDGLIDTEVLVPIDKEITTSGEYRFKKDFLLTNAVKIRHEGNPAAIQNTANAVMSYINERGLIPITCGYNVTVRQPTSQQDINNMVIDIYIGVSPNKL